ncbi:hypothetical protein [Methanoplanus limicola]|uniref:hypothetical protein n=1 Tax=Methanoplanus limicola TaxID=2315 RepID=UPI0012F6542D|nr:hypothetical protein [Methanoplanus limicola]
MKDDDGNLTEYPVRLSCRISSSHEKILETISVLERLFEDSENFVRVKTVKYYPPVDVQVALAEVSE